MSSWSMMDDGWSFPDVTFISVKVQKFKLFAPENKNPSSWHAVRLGPDLCDAVGHNIAYIEISNHN
jgi:hypothetical protein